MVRIDRLGEDAQEVLRVLAVAERADHALLAETSGLDAAALRAALRDAVASHLIVAGADGRHAFRHALLREVVVDDLLPGEREGLHLALARALEAARRGARRSRAGSRFHYSAAGDRPAALARERPRGAGGASASTPTARRRRCSSASSSCGTTSPRPPSSSGDRPGRRC